MPKRNRTSWLARSILRSGPTLVGNLRRRPQIGPLLPSGAFKRGMVAAERPELKVIDTANAAYNCSTTGSVTLINGVAQGTDFTNRIGRKIHLQSVQVRGQLNGVDDTIVPNRSDLYIIYDKQPNGALPAIGDIFTQATSNSFLNLDNRERFRVLCHRTYVLGATTPATPGLSLAPGIHAVEVYQHLKDVDTVFDGTTNAIGDINSGSLLMVWIGNELSTTGAEADVCVRVRFTD